MIDQFADVLVYANGMWRRRWYALSVAVVACIAGWITVALIPDTYSSTARIYVDTQSVLRPLLVGLAVDRDIDTGVRVMKQTLLSRPNVAKVLRETDRDLDVASMDAMERLIKQVQEATTLTSTGTDLFSISNEDTDPKRARNTVQAFLDIFMESQLGNSRTDMEQARRFIDDQLERYQAQLDQAERRLAEFRQQNMLLLGHGGYHQALEAAEKDVATAEAALNDAMLERDVLQQQLQAMPEVVAGGGESLGPPSDQTLRMMQLESQLDQLLSRFTDRHPDVVTLRNQIREVKARQEAEIAAAMRNLGGAIVPTEGGIRGGVPNPAYSQLQFILAEKEANISTLKERTKRAKDHVDNVRSRSLEVPLIETELKRLTRGYDVIKTKHEQFLQRRESAMLAREQEAHGDKVHFRIVDPPEVPVAPSGPNRPAMLGLVLPLGLGLGGGVALVLALVSSAVVNPRKLSEEFGRPVLGSVSLIAGTAAVRRRVLDLSAFALVLVGLFGLFGFLLLAERQVGLGRVVAALGDANTLGQVADIVADVIGRVFG
jgi:polysaccharide chain length determinant protein (PEP-CTERM system associated)